MTLVLLLFLSQSDGSFLNFLDSPFIGSYNYIALLFFSGKKNTLNFLNRYSQESGRDKGNGHLAES